MMEHALKISAIQFLSLTIGPFRNDFFPFRNDLPCSKSSAQAVRMLFRKIRLTYNEWFMAEVHAQNNFAGLNTIYDILITLCLKRVLPLSYNSNTEVYMSGKGRRLPVPL